jgi:hypothetical protein
MNRHLVTVDGELLDAGLGLVAVAHVHHDPLGGFR